MSEQPISSTQLMKFGVELDEAKKRSLDKMILDLRAGLEHAEKSTQSINKTMDNLGKTVDSTSKKTTGFFASIKNISAGVTTKLDSVTGSLRDISSAARIASSGIDAPIKSMIADYEKFASLNDPVLKDWQETTKEIATTNRQIRSELGRAFAQSLQPYQETLADMLNKLTIFMDKNPKLVDAVAKLGAGAISATAVTASISTLAMSITTFASWAKKVIDGLLLIAPKLLAGAKGVAAGAGAVGSAVAGGVGAGLIGTQILASSDLGKQLGVQNLQTTATVAAYSIGQLVEKLGGADGTAQKWAVTIGELTGAIEKATDEQEKYSTAVEGLIEENADMAGAVEIWKNFREQQKQADTDYMESVKRVIESTNELVYNANIANITAIEQAIKSYNKSIESLGENLAKSIAEVNENYYETIQDIVKSGREALQNQRESYRDQIESINKSYLDTIEQLQKQRAKSVESAIAARDAIALAEAQRVYREGAKEAAENRNEQLQEAKKANKEAIAEIKKNTKEQLKETRKNHAEQLADMKEAHEEQVKELTAALAEQKLELEDGLRKQLAEITINQAQQLGALRDGLKKQNEERKKRTLEQLRNLTGFLEDEKEERLKYYALMEDDLVAALKSWRSQISEVLSSPEYEPIDSNLEGKSKGGYVSYGAYRLGEEGKEFVLDNSTTTMLESLLGNLTQSKMKQLAGSGERLGSLSSNMTRSVNMKRVQMSLQQNFSFSGGFSDGEREWFKEQAKQQAYSAFADIMAAEGM